jgi:hypothetical protein
LFQQTNIMLHTFKLLGSNLSTSCYIGLHYRLDDNWTTKQTSQTLLSKCRYKFSFSTFDITSDNKWRLLIHELVKGFTDRKRKNNRSVTCYFREIWSWYSDRCVVLCWQSSRGDQLYGESWYLEFTNAQTLAGDHISNILRGEYFVCYVTQN